jgi:hypothetical protein
MESLFSLTKGHWYEIAFDGGLRARSDDRVRQIND